MVDSTPIIGWFPVLTLILGYALNSVSEAVRHRRAVEREREARNAETQMKAFERRITFQRATLLDLQDAIMNLMRTSGAMHHKDHMTFKQTGQWQKQLYGEELSDANRLAMARTTMLTVRVRDGKVRELVARLKGYTADALISKTPEKSDAAAYEMSVVFEKLNEQIGELLRELDDKDLPSPNAAPL
jgi:hypothetical protein